MSKLKFIKKKVSGRDSSGKLTVRHQGGGQKKFYRIIDFKRDKIGIPGKVVSIEYDPNRNTEIALIEYSDGDKRYILRPETLDVNGVVMSGPNVDIKVGNCLPLETLPIGTVIHNIELKPGKGGQLARGAGTSATIAAKDGKIIQLRLPSAEIRIVSGDCFATVGMLGNTEWKNKVYGKAGTKIHMGIRPTVRGVAQSVRTHPHGGGGGQGIGRPAPRSYAGRVVVGKTRNKKKYSNKYILQRRK